MRKLTTEQTTGIQTLLTKITSTTTADAVINDIYKTDIETKTPRESFQYYVKLNRLFPKMETMGLLKAVTVKNKTVGKKTTKPVKAWKVMKTVKKRWEKTLSV